ncbi:MULTISPECIES: cytochrome P450 [unclassified Streptomyces]|uniref:cytochrome P450 n=1 Tax=unclassified Streptomyces TaxID=2593676 RepID=UPI002252A21A|nr:MULTISPECIES: cytochrome P450 [unclassified Streptomyces]MCX5061476.1 cytochrome P450 [Streptomyces sp. NBC_00452]MCX5292910.1 cytochrome P450 [Streptomyces sp. NBC_00183]
MTTLAIDLTSTEYRLNPWPLYARLRDESPVHHVRGGAADGSDFYVLSRYDDVALALKDKKLFSSQIRRDDYMNLPMLVNRDAPEHTRLRHMANRAFNARLVRTLGDWVQTLVDDLMTEVLSHDRVEFVEAFTTMLPLRVVGGMLGIPLDRKKDLRRWSQAVMDSFAVAAGMDPDEAPGFFEDLMEFGNYMGDLAAERKGKPNQEDILGELVVQHEAGDLTRDELVTMAWSFVAAGHETTMNLLGGGFHMLLSDPELAKRMLAAPERSGDFAEEYLRLNSPTQWLLRRAKEDVELHGSVIPEGALVHVLLGAANRDPRHFPDPDTFDLDRPNRGDHMAFGAGPHFCPGAALSRLLADRAFHAYYDHLDRFSLDPEAPAQYRTRQGSYGIARMDVLVTPTTGDK